MGKLSKVPGPPGVSVFRSQTCPALRHRGVAFLSPWVPPVLPVLGLALWEVVALCVRCLFLWCVDRGLPRGLTSLRDLRRAVHFPRVQPSLRHVDQSRGVSAPDARDWKREVTVSDPSAAPFLLLGKGFVHLRGHARLPGLRSEPSP